ncbi:MAG: hypothetical protein LBH43_18610 [Treponema sp.]|nr:hypothetical protein [Treponema sp.]
MNNNKFWLGILVITLVFAMAVIGYDDNSSDTNPDDGKPSGNAGMIAYSSDGITWTAVSDSKLKKHFCKAEIAVGNFNPKKCKTCSGTHRVPSQVQYLFRFFVFVQQDWLLYLR